MQEQKTLVFGLSGNPPTENHLRLIQHLLRLKHYDFVRVVLNAASPLKSSSDYLPPEARFNLLKAMLKAANIDFNRCVLERFELQRPPPSRMIETLKFFIARAKENNISEKITLVLGMDAFMQFTDWYAWEAYGPLCKLKFYPRVDLNLSEAVILKQLKRFRQVGIDVTLVALEDENICLTNGSATEAREYYRAGRKGCPDGITKEVNQLIREHGYYGATA